MQAVILAAGIGTRLYPLTQNRSKAMQPVLGMPIVGRVMENLLEHQIEDFILVVNPNDNQTLRYLQEEFPLPAKQFDDTSEVNLFLWHFH